MHAPHAPINPTGPQIGWAFDAGGLTFTSRERLPALALSDIRLQVSTANLSRTADAAMTPPHSTGQLRPHHASQGQPLPRVGCVSNAYPLGSVRVHVIENAQRTKRGTRPRVSA